MPVDEFRCPVMASTVAAVEHVPASSRPSRPVCSVCVANYNGIGVVAECLDSVLEQAGDGEVEIIVHDDASADGSVAYLKKRYPQVELLVSSSNVGYCMANNRMVRHARGEFVLLLNNDAALLPGAFDALLEVARDGRWNGIFALPQYDWQSGSLVDRGCLLDPFYNPVPNLDPSRNQVAMVMGACMFMRCSLWNELGGFPESFGSIAEDVYICCVARLRGFPVCVTAESGYRHRQGHSFSGVRAGEGKLQTTIRRRALSERNKTSTMVICTPTLLVWPLLVLHCVLLAIEGALLALLKFDARPWHEIYAPTLRSVMHELSNLRVQRQTVQRACRVTLGAYLDVFTLMPRKLMLLSRHGLPKFG